MRELSLPIHTQSTGGWLGLMPEIGYRVGLKEIAKETMKAGFLLSIHLHAEIDVVQNDVARGL